MEYSVTRYENYGEGFEKIVHMNLNDRETYEFIIDLEFLAYKRIRGSGIIGLIYEGITEDKMGKVQITIERVVD